MNSNDEAKLANSEEWREYIPQTPPRSVEFFRNDLTLLRLIPETEVGEVLLLALEKADEYANTYDEALRPDFSKLSSPSQIIGNRLFDGFRRALDAYRKASYFKSRNNGGGTVKKTTASTGNHPSYTDVEQFIRERKYTHTAQQFFARMEQVKWTMADGKPINMTNWQSAVMLFESGKI